MRQLIQDSVIQLAEQLQLPEKIIHRDDLPWVTFDEGDMNCLQTVKI